MTKPSDAIETSSAARSGRSPFATGMPLKLRQFNRKIPAPSVRMHVSDGYHYQCSWLHDSITVHSDGNVSCGLDDPHGQRSFGNIQSQTIEEIFLNPEYSNLQSKLWDGYRCADCTLYRRETENFTRTAPKRPNLPSTLIIEPTVRCNIRCLNDACHANNDATIRTRDTDMLSYGLFTALIDQLRLTLQHVYFFNYGDPFVHAQAEDMLLYLRAACPDVQVVTSTNGIPLAKPERATKIVRSSLNMMFFTIGGITQASYEKYHIAGRVDLALQGMKNILDARKEAAAALPVVVWRYLLFRWNDSLEEVDEAIRISQEFGVDIFHLYLTHVPNGAWSFRFAPGTPNFAKYRKYMECALDYTRCVGLIEPDDHGFFWEEDVKELGRARWTGYRARLTCSGRSGWIRLGFATTHETARDNQTVVFIATPWQTVKLRLGHLEWRNLAMRVPREFRSAPVPIRIATPSYWFPAEELGTNDTRCLGVLVRAEDETRHYGKSHERSSPTGGEPLTEADIRALADLVPDVAIPAPLPDLRLGGRMTAIAT